eukprot:XP_796825.2 PREDICTED: DNA polymerase epsilon subunit 2 [Strongylocentrotus purpuratus]
MADKVKTGISAAFKMNGLALRSNALKYLVAALTPVTEIERNQWIEKIIEAVQKQPLSSALLDKAIIEAAINECSDGGKEENEKMFNVIDSFTVPRYTYNAERKKFLMSNDAPNLHASAKYKADLFRERYNILLQRTSRHSLFSPPVQGASNETQGKKFQLKPVEFLLGSTAKLGELIVLGMLTQLKEGKFHLEDPTGAVQLDLAKAQFHTGLFTENCFVLAEGWYEDEVFHVNGFGFPPAEPADTTRSYFGNLNFFGGPSATCAKSSTKLKLCEQEKEDAMMVFLSDVWLDKVDVQDKLRILLTGYSEMPPMCFVFCGNFTSTPYGPSHNKILKESLQTLANMICEFSTLVEQSRFIFVPGPEDPGPGNVLPRPPIPECLTEVITSKVPTAVFTTNPCRLQYCTQEIIVFKEDIVMKMCRNCIRFPDNNNEIPDHFVKTIVSQGHLCPLPLHVCPVYWAYDNALRIYPLPDVIVLGDKYDPFTITNVGTTCTNTGSFSKSGYCFKVYYPHSKEIEDSKIDEMPA